MSEISIEELRRVWRWPYEIPDDATVTVIGEGPSRFVCVTRAAAPSGPVDPRLRARYLARPPVK
jgi:hypothetical protein